MVREEFRDASGRFKGGQYTIYDRPFPENQDAVLSDAVNQELSKKEDIQRNNTNTPKPPEGADLFDDDLPEAKSSKDDKLEAEFQEFWKAYGKVGNTEPAKRKYRIARKELSQKDLLNAVSNYLASLPDWRTPSHASTWLNQKLWKDYLEGASDPVDQASAAYGEAIIKWQQGGKVGDMPRREDFEVKA
jgi:hypothetical protein